MVIWWGQMHYHIAAGHTVETLSITIWQCSYSGNSQYHHIAVAIQWKLCHHIAVAIQWKLNTCLHIHTVPLCTPSVCGIICSVCVMPYLSHSGGSVGQLGLWAYS